MGVPPFQIRCGDDHSCWPVPGATAQRTEFDRFGSVRAHSRRTPRASRVSASTPRSATRSRAPVRDGASIRGISPLWH